MVDLAEVTGLIGQGEYERAEMACQEALRRRQDDAGAWFYLAAAQNSLNRPAEAVRSLCTAAGFSSDPEQRLRIAQALVQLRAYPAAMPILEGLDFAQPRVVRECARCRWGLGEYERALTHLAGLWEVLPDWAGLALTYARCLVNLDRPTRAAEVLDEALGHHPGDAMLRLQRALLMVSTDSPGRARGWLAGLPEAPRTEALELLCAALDRLSGEPPGSEPACRDRRLAAQWEGFGMLVESPGEPDWFGDNVALLKRALASAPEGVVVECGVLHGRTLNLMADWAPGRRLFGFDSFEGLPEDWSGRERAGSYSTGGRLPEVRANCELIPGWFSDTLPEFADRLDAPIALLHIDCDLYSSARCVLDHLGARLAPGALVVFDEFTGYPGWREHEYRAWNEYLAGTGRPARLVLAQLMGQSAAWRVEP